MIERKEATYTTTRCDMPGCIAECGTFDAFMAGGPAQERPEGWRSVSLDPNKRPDTEEGYITLCPKHADPTPALRLRLFVMDRGRVTTHD